MTLGGAFMEATKARGRVTARLVGVLSVAASLLATAVLVAPQAEAARLPPAPTWGACGVSTDPEKVVHDFGGMVLRCGGPKYSRTPTWGYRHILWRHRSQFETLAAPARLNWRDLAHWAIDTNIKDPDHVVVEEDTGCRDRVLYLADDNGRVYKVQRFRLVYNAVSGRIITVYPTSAVCRPQDLG